MPCIPILSDNQGYRTRPDGTTEIIRKTVGFICFSPFYRLRLSDGRYVFMAWHNYCGPTFYHDRAEKREIENWWEDEEICTALDWFQERGNKA